MATRGSTVYHYHYNNRDRLDELTIGSTVTADYTYDGLERLAIRTTQNMSPAGTTHYLYDLAGHLLVEADDTGQTLREYVWLGDMPLAVVSDVNTGSPNLYYVHADQIDTPVMMTDDAKNVVWNALFLPFGSVESITGSATNNLRFPGQYFLIEDGLHYNWYRHYDPTLGRYVRPDPLGVAGGPSVYAYARSSPITYVDPRGDQWANVAGAAAGFVGGFAGSLFEQGIHQALSGELCPPPINVSEAIANGLAGAYVGVFNPVTGLASLTIAVTKGAFAGIFSGIILGSIGLP
jgi:RHS repeat-associated protein